jgi:hypothetical protein
MIKPEVLDALVAAGCTAQQIAAAVKADQKRSSGAERQARYRARKASQSDESDVTSVTVTSPPSPKKEIPPTPPKEKTTPSPLAPNGALGASDFFADFWLAYPRREGPNPKKPARLVFERLVAKGANPQRIISEARLLAKEHPTPTRFVPQAVTWLNQERFDDAEPVLTGQAFCPSDWRATPFLVARYRRERQTDPPPIIDSGNVVGFMLPAEWVAIAKQGQEDGERLENQPGADLRESLRGGHQVAGLQAR